MNISSRKWHKIPCVTMAIICVYRKEATTATTYKEPIKAMRPTNVLFTESNPFLIPGVMTLSMSCCINTVEMSPPAALKIKQTKTAINALL